MAEFSVGVPRFENVGAAGKSGPPRISVRGKIVGRLRQKLEEAPFFPEDLHPHIVRFLCKNPVQVGGVADPRFSEHFVLELSRAPPGVSREDPEFVRGQEGFTDFDERLE